MPADPARPASGARPARGALGLLGAEDARLERVRRIFLTLALAACSLAAVAVGAIPDRTAGLRLAGLVAVAALAAVWLRAYRCGALSPWDEPIELLALFAVGLAAGPDAAIAVVCAGLYLRVLYGSRRRAGAGLAVYGLAYLASVIVAGAHRVADAAELLVPLAIGCAVMHAFASILGRHERALRRERILRDASAALVTARDRAAVHAATMRAVEQLGNGRAPAAALAVARGDGFDVRAACGAWLPGLVSSRISRADLPNDLAAALSDGRPCGIASPRAAGLELYAPPEVAALAGACVPLSARGELRGFVAAFGPATSDGSEVGALAALAGEAALALAALDAADAAADDRSLQRLHEHAAGMI